MSQSIAAAHVGPAAVSSRSSLVAARPSRLRMLLRIIGPAWVVMLADVDAPSVLTAAKAGTDFRYAMLLPIIALIPVLYLVQEMTARLAVGTGMGHAELIRERYGMRWATVAVLSMVVIDLLAYTAQFAGIVLGASLLGIGAVPAVAGALVVHSLIVLTRSYRRFELIAIGMSLALFAFVALAVTTGPDLGAVLGGLSPLMPIGQPGFVDLMVATIGAVIMPWMLFYQQAATVDKGLRPADLPAARVETAVGAVASEVLMAAIVIAAATAVGLTAVGPTSAGGLVLPAGLANLAGDGMGLLIGIGIVGSGLLAAIVVSLSAAWAWSELFRWPHSLNLSIRKAPGFYALYLLEVFPAALVALVAKDLIAVVLDAMVLNVVVLVVPLVFLVKLSSDRTVLGELANSRRRAAILWVMTVVLVGLGLYSAAGLALGAHL